MKILSLLLFVSLLLPYPVRCQPDTPEQRQSECKKEHIQLSRYGAYIENSEFTAPGGFITVTDSSLIFTPIKTFFARHVSITEIPLREISGVTRTNTFGIVPNGIIVQLRDVTSQKFKTILLRRKKLYLLLLSQAENNRD